MISAVVTRLLLLPLRCYRLLVSPLLGCRCRFVPGCAEYAQDALCIHGPLRGGWLALKRLLRCHPWGGEGFDPVPPRAPRP